jgi:hypothetical protein
MVLWTQITGLYYIILHIKLTNSSRVPQYAHLVKTFPTFKLKPKARYRVSDSPPLVSSKWSVPLIFHDQNYIGIYIFHACYIHAELILFYLVILAMFCEEQKFWFSSFAFSPASFHFFALRPKYFLLFPVTAPRASTLVNFP